MYVSPDNSTTSGRRIRWPAAPRKQAGAERRGCQAERTREALALSRPPPSPFPFILDAPSIQWVFSGNSALLLISSFRQFIIYLWSFFILDLRSEFVILSLKFPVLGTSRLTSFAAFRVREVRACLFSFRKQASAVIAVFFCAGNYRTHPTPGTVSWLYLIITVLHASPH